VRSHNKRYAAHHFPCNLVQSRKVLLAHELQLTAPNRIANGHHKCSVDKTESTGIGCNCTAAGDRPRQQGGLIAGVGANVLSENLLERPARWLHDLVVDSNIA